MVAFIFIICFDIYDYLFQKTRPLFYAVFKIHIVKPPQGHSGTVKKAFEGNAQSGPTIKL